MSGTHQLLVFAGDVNALGGNKYREERQKLFVG